MNDEEHYRSLGPWLAEKDAAGALLVVEFAGGVRMCPAWQFDADGKPLPGLAAVLDALRPAFRSAASQAGWLCGIAYVGGDLKRWEYLAGYPGLVELWAREDAERVTRR